MEHKYKLKNRVLIVLLAFAMTFILAGCTEDSSSNNLPAEGELAVHFIDVGQADCTLLISEDEAMLIDAGNREDSRLILNYLDYVGIDSLKYIVFTHPHEDHIGSGEAIINAVDVEKIFMLDEYDQGMEGYLKDEIEYLGIETEMPYPGDTAQLGECRIDFLGPEYDYKDANDDSICLKVTHGSNSMLFTGDAGNEAERDMIDAGTNLEADLLHAGHHGSSTSNSYYFLRQSNPRYIVISCEKDNMYGHPHKEALSRFNDLGAEIFRTDTQGTIVALSDGNGIAFNVEGKKADKPYTEDFEESKYVGNINSKKYHKPTCGGLPADDNRTYFKTKEAAEKAGYDPCGNCRP